MKLGINEINEGIYNAAINKVIRQLQREGFKTYPDYRINDYNNVILDLFAAKGSDKRIYEFKIGRNRIQKRQFEILQHYARQIGARLFIIYLEIPTSKEIIFENLDEIIFDNLINDTPNDLLELATHVRIEDVNNIDINSLEIKNGFISIAGTGFVSIETQMGSRRDLRENNGYLENFDFEFTFRLRLDKYNYQLLYSYYKFDTGSYYD